MIVEQVERRLAAILAADVVGFSRLTGADEEGTIALLREVRSDLVDPLIARHRGRIIKTMGDGILVEFASVVDAVRASLEIQSSMTARNTAFKPENRIEFRIGIHVGDVMVEPDGDLLGDSINIAARIETVAEPGGIFLSEDAYRQVRDRLKEEFVDIGERQFKNIARQIRVFAIKSARRKGAAENEPATSESAESDGLGPAKSKPPRKGRAGRAHSGPLKLPTQVRIRAPGLRLSIKTAEEAIKVIDRRLPAEMMSLPRWTFARALLTEAIQTGKSRDVNAAVRQLTQALRNEHWLDEVAAG
jgi:class 3 adenylate cyclase